MAKNEKKDFGVRSNAPKSGMDFLLSSPPPAATESKWEEVPEQTKIITQDNNQDSNNDPDFVSLTTYRVRNQDNEYVADLLHYKHTQGETHLTKTDIIALIFNSARLTLGTVPPRPSHVKEAEQAKSQRRMRKVGK